MTALLWCLGMVFFVTGWVLVWLGVRERAHTLGTYAACGLLMVGGLGFCVCSVLVARS